MHVLGNSRPFAQVRCLFLGLQYVCLPKSSAKVIICFEFLQLSDTRSFAQRLQLRVPSMESLFRSPVKESLFCSSSKESLIQASSGDSLNRLDLDAAGPAFDSTSDMESETEEPLRNMDSLSKEQMRQRLRRMERSLGNYRGKYSEWLLTQSRPVKVSAESL
uniref:Uncharacterized protein n=1 Tax=Strix occidentalis caurina TaxID=311401 RepID=A0A8D0KSD3_STROC